MKNDEFVEYDDSLYNDGLANDEEMVTDNLLGMYLKEIRKYPLLSSEEEKDLFIRMGNGDLEAKEKLIKSNLKLVVNIAIKMGKMGDGHLKILDSIQNGNLGLITAVEKFDISKGFKFSTYAIYWIRQSVGREYNNTEQTIRIPVKKNLDYRLYKKYKMNYFKDFGVYPSDEEIMKFFSIDAATLKSLNDLDMINPESLNTIINDNEDSELEDFVAYSNNEYKKYEDSIDKKILMLTIKEKTNNYNYYIIYNRIFANPIKTLEYLGQELNITRERVRQIEKKELNRIKASLYDEKTKTFIKKKSILQRYSIEQVEKMDLEPKTLNEIILLINIKQLLEELEYYIIYNLHFSKQKMDIVQLSRILSISPSLIKNIEQEASKKVENLLKMSGTSQFNDLKKEFCKRYGIKRIFNADIYPTYEIIDYKKIADYFSTCNYDELQLDNADYFNMLSDKQLKLIKRYFVASNANMSKRDLYIAMKEINLKLLGYNKSSEVPKSLLLKAYKAQKNQFTLMQQANIEYGIFKTITKEECEKLYGEVDEYAIAKYKHYITFKLERVLFGIDNYFETVITKDQVEKVFSSGKCIFTDIQERTLKLYYGIDNERKFSISEIAELLKIDYVQAHDRLDDAKEKVIKFYLGMTTYNIVKNSDKYSEYIKNVQYEMTSNTRELLARHLLDGKTYDDISKEFGLTNYNVSNIITEGIRKIEFFRYEIIKPLVFSKSDLDNFYVICKGDFDNQKRDWIYRRYFLGQTSEDISNQTGIDKEIINNVFDSFNKQFIRYKCKLIPSLDDYFEDINAHKSDSVLGEQEKEFASFYYGLVSNYNKEGIKLSKSDIKSKYHLTECRYNHILENITYKMKQKLSGLLTSEYGLISRKDLELILKDKRLPLSEKEISMLKHLKETDGYEYLSDEELAEKYDMTRGSVKRRYQRAILSIKQYQAGDLEPSYSYELDIEPILKYFSEYDVKIIEKIYREKMSIAELCKEINTTRDIALTHLDRIKTNIFLILKNEAAAKKFNFEYARKVIRNNDLPLYENKDLMIKIYEMAFGEDGYERMSVPQIIKKLNLSYNNNTVNNVVYSVMTAVEKYKIGIRKREIFTEEQARDYYNQKCSSMNTTEKYNFDTFFSRVERKFEINRRNSYFTEFIIYQLLCHYEKLLFKFDESNAIEAKKLLTKEEISITNKTRKALQGYYGITDRDLMSGKEKLKVFKLLNPIYQRRKEFANQKIYC